MLMNRKEMWAAAVAMCCTTISQAGSCPCRPHGGIRTVSAAQDKLLPTPQPEPSAADPSGPTEVMPLVPPAPGSTATSPPSLRGLSPPGAGAGGQTMPMPNPVARGEPAPAGLLPWWMLPPPGTLGQTYQRRSALVDDAEHPRHAVVVVKLPEQADVSARGLKVKWTGNEWRLETAQPLVPGVPHIYAVQAEWDTPTGRTKETRWVRLIMGRVVDLEF